MKELKTALLIIAIFIGALQIYFVIDERFLGGKILPVPLTNIPSGLQTAPPLKAPDLEGNMVELSQFKDKVVLVNFWASWCTPCAREFPSLINMINQFNGDVILLAVSDDDTLEAAKEFISSRLLISPHMKVLWSKDFWPAKLFQINRLPETFIFSRGGIFAKRVSGFHIWDNEKSLQYIKSLLGKN